MTSARFIYIFLLSWGKANEINPFVYVLLYSLTVKRNLNSVEIPVVKCLWRIRSAVILIFSVCLLKIATKALRPSFWNSWYSLEKCKFTRGNLYNNNFPLLHSLFLQLQTLQHVHTMITIYFIQNSKLIVFIFPQFINHLWMLAFRPNNKKHWWWRHLKHSIGTKWTTLILNYFNSNNTTWIVKELPE